MTDKADILLSRYFSGEATEKELRELDEWIAASEENEAYFFQMTSLYENLSMQPPVSDHNHAKAFSDFKNHINGGDCAPKKRRIKFSPALKAVAASAVLLIGVFTYYILQSPAETIVLTAESNSKEYTLFEEATVVLEANSQINYSAEKRNELELVGKATFSVNSKQEEKLIVQAGETFIKDIGTVFTITAYNAGEPIMVEVFEGEVLFYTANNTGVTVNQNEIAIYDPVKQEFTYIQMEETVDEVIFTATPLYEVVNILEARYTTQIRIESSLLEDMQISVSFDKYETIDNILEIIAETLGLNVSKAGNGYVIY